MKPKAYSYLRMSTDLQLKGDSRRRQLEASKAYAEANGLTLADDAQLEDIGVSAFRGANVRDGALGQFLEAVETGKVLPGSYLLVESLDRLSREQVRIALSLFLRIGQAGITLITLMDGRVHRPDDTDISSLMMSLVSMNTAHEESQKKSVRVGAAWRNKRALASASGKPMTARCPGWLRLSDDRTRYEIAPERAEIVKSVFSDYVAGVGMYTIARRLNEAKTPAFEGRNGWHQSSVKKMLGNRAAIGEFQPHVKRDGSRIAEGEPISGYYPAVVDEALFYRAQDAKRERATSKGRGAGRKGPTFANLFTNLARCAYCRSPMTFENKGKGTKGGTYLVCDGAKRRRGCPATRWRYRDFEASFLAFVTELDVEAMINEGDEIQKRQEVESAISSTQGELSSVEQQMHRTYDLLTTGVAMDFVSGKLRELERRQNDLKERLVAKREELNSLAGRTANFYESKDEVRTFVDRLQRPDATELYKLRAQIASRLRTLVDSLIVAPLGDRPKTEKVIDFLRGQPGATDVISQMETRIIAGDDDAPYFAVGFRNGSVRAVFPANGDAMGYRQQILANKTGIRFLGQNQNSAALELTNLLMQTAV
jgi:DNA invertase Pin-like site-specific DNA recombinase